VGLVQEAGDAKTRTGGGGGGRRVKRKDKKKSEGLCYVEGKGGLRWKKNQGKLAPRRMRGSSFISISNRGTETGPELRRNQAWATLGGRRSKTIA